MGGTSTDVSHYAGELERSYESVVGGVRLRAPMLRVHTVAAGGGSHLRLRGRPLPGRPAQRRRRPRPGLLRQGRAAHRDRLQPRGRQAAAVVLPARVRAGRRRRRSTRRRRAQALAAVAASMRAAGVEPPAPEQLADDFIRVACEAMARAIKRISTQRGHDVTGHVLCCFGGAAGQHACLVADALGMTQVLLHPLAGVLSAYGMGLADVRALRERSVEAPLERGRRRPRRPPRGARGGGRRTSSSARASRPRTSRVERRGHVKYRGTDVALPVPWAAPAEMAAAFLDAAPRALRLPDARARPHARGRRGRGGGRRRERARRSEDRRRAPRTTSAAAGRRAPPAPRELAGVFTGGRRHEAPVYVREDLPPAAVVEGPAIICEPTSTTVVEPGWRAEVLAGGELLLRRTSPPARPSADPGHVSPLLLEVFNSLFMSIAEQMGATLANTAVSVNIKERLDFSCAVFDAEGGLVANAPHLPVHLGSMGASVRAVLERRRSELRPGRRLAAQLALRRRHPPAGPDGGHAGVPGRAPTRRPLFFVASRAHHADVGGVTPGSMPPGSRTIDEEGVLIEDFRLVEDGRLREAEVAQLLTTAAHPVRDLQQNLADLRAQVAANARGAAELARMVAEFGLPVVAAYMRHVQDNAAEAVRRVLDRFAGAAGAPRASARSSTTAARSSCAVTVDRSRAPRRRRLHRHVAAARRQLQRARRR